MNGTNNVNFYTIHDAREYTSNMKEYVYTIKITSIKQSSQLIIIADCNELYS